MRKHFPNKEQLNAIFNEAHFFATPNFTVSPVLGTKEQAADAFAIVGSTDPYARFGNATNRYLEKIVAQAEGGQSALAVTSGTTAIRILCDEMTRPGDELISSKYIFGGTLGMFKGALKKKGCTVHFADPTDPQSFADAITDKTRGLFVESLSNAYGIVPNFKGLSEVAKEKDIPLIVDSTFTPPYLFQPIKYGADVVIHSATKFFSGAFSNMGLGGVIIDAGTFPWEHNPNYPTFYESPLKNQGLDVFHLEMWKSSGAGYGVALDEDHAVHILERLPSLSNRLDHHAKNTKSVIEFLTNQNEVTNIVYVGLENHPSYAAGQHYLNDSGSIFQFDVKNPAGLINNLNYIENMVNVGQERTIICHPASTTHRQLTPDEQKNAGISQNTIRLSVGAEDDVYATAIHDLKNALRFA